MWFSKHLEGDSRARTGQSRQVSAGGADQPQQSSAGRPVGTGPVMDNESGVWVRLSELYVAAPSKVTQ